MSIELQSSVASPLKHGHKIVGTTAVQLKTTNPQKMYQGVLVRADSNNTDVVYVGTSSSVTADNNEGTGGMPLPAGSSINVPTDDITKIWVISTASSQDVAWIGA